MLFVQFIGVKPVAFNVRRLLFRVRVDGVGEEMNPCYISPPCVILLGVDKVRPRPGFWIQVVFGNIICIKPCIFYLKIRKILSGEEYCPSVDPIPPVGRGTPPPYTSRPRDHLALFGQLVL